MVVNPYATDEVTFSVEGAGGNVVGVVQNSATSACVEPRDTNQKLGSGRGASDVGLSGLPIRATFSDPLSGPAYVFAEFQTTTDSAQILLFDSQDRDITSFSVLATSTNPPISYKWLFNGSAIPGATSHSLSISNAQIANLGAYQVVVSDQADYTYSAVATLDLLDALFITSQPISRTVLAGSNATFAVAAYGAAPLPHQWRLNGTDVPNETNSILLVPNVQSALLGDYTVILTNNYAAVTSAVATLTLLIPPIITQPPMSVTVIAGENATFTVTVTNTATLPIYYQWRKGSVSLTNIPLHSTTCSFTLYNVQTNVTFTNGPGNYRVVVSNSATIGGGSLSTVALTVLTASPPAVLTGLASNVTSTAVTLTGSVNPLGSTTTFHFEYGLTTSYGASTPAAAAGNGTNVLAASGAVAGLLPGTNYHYRIVASNNGGLSTGIDQTFTTVALGPLLTLVSDGSGGYFLRFTGVPGLGYRSQRAPSVAGPWETIDTQTAPASGFIEVHDTSPLPGQAFYRAVQP